MTNSSASSSHGHRGTFSLWDAVSLLTGIVIGTAIFRMPGTVFQNVSSPLEGLSLWLAGGLLSLAGAFCYAELAAAYPRSGGDYEYLSRAYGPGMGLQFAWAQLLIVLTGSVGSMAYAFADYTRVFWDLPRSTELWFALGAVAVLTIANMCGMRIGKWTQNLLTISKLIGLAAIACLALWGDHWSDLGTSIESSSPNIGLSMVFILYAYSGWTHAAYVAANVDDPQRTLPRALLAGVGAVTLIYLVVNVAFVAILGFEDVRDSATPATASVSLIAGPAAGRLVSLLVMLSALGAINGTILTGAHVLRELGRDYRPVAWLGGTRGRAATPARALLAIGVATMSLILAVGTEQGRSMIDAALLAIRLPEVPWNQYYGGFETLVAAAAPLFWLFLLLTGTTLFVLRWRDPERPRPFRTPGYPLTPIAFCAACFYMLWRSIEYARGLTLIAAIPILSALVIHWCHRTGSSTGSTSEHGSGSPSA